MKKVICNVMAICLLAGSGISCGAQEPVERTEVQFIYYLMELEQQLAAAKKKQEAEKKTAVKKEESKTSVASKILKGLAIALGVAGTAVLAVYGYNCIAKNDCNVLNLPQNLKNTFQDAKGVASNIPGYVKNATQSVKDFGSNVPGYFINATNSTRNFILNIPNYWKNTPAN